MYDLHYYITLFFFIQIIYICYLLIFNRKVDYALSYMLYALCSWLFPAGEIIKLITNFILNPELTENVYNECFKATESDLN